MTNPKFDDRDAEILAARIAKRNEIEGPRIGDYVVFDGGWTERFSHDWGDATQTSLGGSFHLGENGRAGFSGGLNDALPVEMLELTEETRDGAFWFFHHNLMQAHNGVDAVAPCRVYRYAGPLLQNAVAVTWYKQTHRGPEAGEYLTRCPKAAQRVASSKRLNYFEVETRQALPEAL